MQIGILGALGLVFVVCKLMGVIAWSWWLVLLPLYGGFAIFLLIAIATVALAVSVNATTKGKW